MSNTFCHLHVHDQYSQLDGFGKAEQYAARAQELGFKYLALTNHGNVDGLVSFQKACKDKGITPVLGTELYMVPDKSIKEKGEKRFHITLLIKSKAGLTNVFKMLSEANLDGFYGRPRIDPNLLMDHSEGLIFMSACTSSVYYMPGGEQLLLDLDKKHPGCVYLEAMPHDYQEQKDLNRLLMTFCTKSGIPMVATNDCHYPLSDNSKAQEVLLAIQSNKKWNDPHRWRFDVGGLHLKTREEMVDAFLKQRSLPPKIFQRALDRTIEVAEKCNGYTIEKIDVVLPKVPGYEDRDETELMHELIKEGFVERLLRPKRISRSEIPAYKQRMEEEFALICELGFQRYFLIVWELISWCKKNDIMTGPGRGSVGGSLVAYLMYITDVDPIKYGLVFARFISPARIDLPDIDMDFEDIKRSRIREHLEECYGKYNVVGLSTFAKMKGRGAIRDVARVFDISVADTDKAAKAIVVRSGGDFRSDFTIEDACETFEDAISYKKKYPEVVKLAIELEGQIRGSGQHAAAMCISSEDLRTGERCHFCSRKGTMVANWDKFDAEHMGLMKLDVLCLSALTILSTAKRMVKANYGKDIVFDDIPLDDQAVFDEIAQGNNVGAFQIGSLGLMKICKEMGVKDFNDIVLATALFRPGTLRAGMVSEFIQRRTGRSEVKYIHPLLEPITSESLGIVLYQEQVMWFMYNLGGLPWKTCDTVRKVMSKSQGDEQFKKFKQVFIDGCRERNTLSEDEAGHVWDQLSSFGSYGFNKSHSVEYSMITYWDMWMKIHYPKEFLCATLTYGDKDKKEEYIEEARRLGLVAELPRIGFSKATEWMPSPDPNDNRIFIPFSEIRGVGKVIANKLESLSIEDFRRERPAKASGFFKFKKANTIDIKPKSINSRIYDVLIRTGAVDDRALTEEELVDISQHFDFNLSKDRKGKLAKLHKLLLDRMSLRDIATIDYQNPEHSSSYYFGRMTEVRFGYRQNLLKSTFQKADIKGTAESLGGVYGNLKDDSDFTMIVFESALYHKKKFDIEHCAGEWILARASHPKRTTNIFANEAWIGHELLSCDLKDLEVALIREKSYQNKSRDLLPYVGVKPGTPEWMQIWKKNPGLQKNMIDYQKRPEKFFFTSDCNDCELREGCRAPVPPSYGKYDVVVSGEGPGRDEDREGEGFVGPAGGVLWSECDKYGLTRKQFHITNVVKCYPNPNKTVRTPSKKHITACSKYFEEEIENVKPVMILAFGNTNVKVFKGQDTGITELNGTTEWSDKYGCWISWCIHPAAVLYNPDANRQLFEEGIANFAAKLENLGINRTAKSLH